MFYYLMGTAVHLEEGLAVIDCGGVGYACHTTTTTLSKIRRGEAVKLYTHCVIKEDAFDIYGFYTLEELKSFQQLIAVTGVGPKAAAAILSATTPDKLALAVMTGDEKALTRVSGIGKKTAQRIILELKDKLGAELSAADSGFDALASAVSGTGKAQEATAALVALGYSPSEAGVALKDIDIESLPIEDIIRQALKKMLK